MNAEIKSIEPKHCKPGKTKCVLKYRARSVNEGNGEIEIELSRVNDNIQIVDNGKPKKRNFKNYYQDYEEIIILIVKSSHDPLQAGIKMHFTDNDRKVDFDIIDFTYG